MQWESLGLAVLATAPCHPLLPADPDADDGVPEWLRAAVHGRAGLRRLGAPEVPGARRPSKLFRREYEVEVVHGRIRYCWNWRMFSSYGQSA